MKSQWRTVLPCALVALSIAGWTTEGQVRAASQAARTSARVEPSTRGGLPALRRLNEEHYKRTSEDLFGPGLKVAGRFEPRLPEAGPLAIGDGIVPTPSTGLATLRSAPPETRG